MKSFRNDRAFTNIQQSERKSLEVSRITKTDESAMRGKWKERM
jgi:hypothetical protein